MSRFSETAFSVTLPGSQAGAALPGFAACPVAPVPPGTLHLWHAIYQQAFVQALARALEDSQPTRYQRLVLRVCVN
jgi:hypothetical protein